MSRDVVRATAWGLATSLGLAALVVIGSRNLQHFDAALVAYTFSILFATFGLAYRYAMWLQRPPTALYWRGGWRAFLRPGAKLRNVGVLAKRLTVDVLGNRFILRRDRLRGFTHLLIMWGCILAAAITFPLVFGWLYFRPVPDDLERYRVVVFGFETVSFRVASVTADLIFHGLVWASVLVIAGVMLAMRRRMREAGAAALQRFAEDLVPLILLFAVSLTGLMLTASYTWMEGYAYEFIALMHAVTVIATFLWLPFGKFFHIFQRPAQMGVTFYKDAGTEAPPATCRRCATPFTSQTHALDLIECERRLGYRYEADDPDVPHYQWLCPPCRRASFALAQTRRWLGVRGGREVHEPVSLPRRAPRFVNPAIGLGPLGNEDAENRHL